MTDVAQRDECIGEAAARTGYIDGCRLVSDQDLQEGCMAAVTRNATYCRGIRSEALRRYCCTELLGSDQGAIDDCVGEPEPDEEGAELLLIMLALFATAALPTIVHLGVTLLSIGLKVFAPVAQKPSMLILRRLYESKKGVLTLLSVAIGSSAKLVQLWICE